MKTITGLPEPQYHPALVERLTGHQSGHKRPSSACDVLDRVSMADILTALNVKSRTRGNRTICPVHNGNNETLSFNETKGAWYCFSCGEGGGKVALVSKVYGYKPQQALRWIAGIAGIELDQWTSTQALQHAAAMQQAAAKANRLVEWRNQVIDELREQRDLFQDLYYWARRIGKAEEEAQLWQIIVDFDRRIQWHRGAPWLWLADIYEQAMEAAEAA